MSEETEKPKQTTARVRVAVAVLPTGRWSALGWSGSTDREASQAVVEGLDDSGEEVYFVEATLPIPVRTHPVAIEGEVCQTIAVNRSEG